MMNPLIRVRALRVMRNGKETGELNYWFQCPGCDETHRYAVNAPAPAPSWTFNGNLESPTFTPSLLMRTTRGPEQTPHVCHLFLTDGKLHFCGDCTHALAGQTVEIPELPEWLR